MEHDRREVWGEGGKYDTRVKGETCVGVFDDFEFNGFNELKCFGYSGFADVVLISEDAKGGKNGNNGDDHH